MEQEMKSMNCKTGTLLYMGLVLILAGLIGLVFQVRPAQSAQAKPSSMDMAGNGSLDGRSIPSSARTRQYDDRVIFRYLDEDFVSVAVIGSFSDWEPIAMELDPKSGAWSVTVAMTAGRHAYEFIVEDQNETWEALDPSNLRARKSVEHGWVSLVTVPEDGYDDPAAGEEDEDSEPDTAIVKFDLDFDPPERYKKPDWDDEEHWRNHRRRYIKREMDLLYDQSGVNGSFQRVDGFSMGVTPGGISRDDFGPAAKGLFSYGFRREEWTIGGTLIQPLLENRRLMAMVSGYSGTDYRDNTGIGSLENSLAGVFFREDFRDYYQREGITLSLVAYPTSSIRLEAGYESSDYESLEAQETWSFASGDFAENPAVDEGTMRTYFAKAMIGTRNNNLVASWESGLNREDDAFDFSMLSTSYRGRIRMSDARYLDFRAMYVTGLSGELPSQRRMPVGGLGTVRGYYYQSLLTPDPELVISSAAKGGQRALVANFEYAFSFDTDITWNPEPWDTDSWDEFEGFEHIDIDSSLFLFFDTGMAWENRSADFDLSELKSSAGVGFQFDDNGPRFDIVKTLDDGGHDTLFQIRLERMF
jgi:Glycogen recognition site of AMP-activated protein kinase